MKRASIRILHSAWEKLRREALGTSMDESVAFMTANYFETPDRIVFLCDSIVPARPGDYLKRGELHLEVSPLYISRVLNIAENKSYTAIMVHSHPFDDGKPQYSVTDDIGEARTSETISKCLERNPPVGSLLFGQNNATARAWTGLAKKHFPSDITVLNEKSYQRHCDLSPGNQYNRELVNRQTRALGDRTQDNIESLYVGIVGLGGTGSNVAEQLVRMGIQKLALVDHDTFEPSNWSRLYGSTLKDTAKNRLKVEIVASHLHDINPKVACNVIGKSVMSREVLHLLSGCDIIFSCLDRHAPRAVLNELSYQCFVPVIDVGVGLIKEQGGVLGGSIRATIIGPNLPCLFCQELVRPEMITTEHLSPEEYAARRAEGYASELEQHALSIISYTTMASSLGLMMFLEFISDTKSNTAPTLLFDLKNKDVIKLRPKIKSECVCKKRLGQGLRMPFSIAD